MAKFSRRDIKQFFQDTTRERLDESMGIRDEMRGMRDRFLSIGQELKGEFEDMKGRGREMGDEVRRELEGSVNSLVGLVEDTGKILNVSNVSLGKYLIVDATVAQYDKAGKLISGVYGMPRIYFIEVDQNILSKLETMPRMKTPATFYAMIKGEHGGRPDPNKVGDAEIPRRGEYIVVSNPTSIKVIQIPISETIDNPPPLGYKNIFSTELIGEPTVYPVGEPVGEPAMNESHLPGGRRRVRRSNRDLNRENLRKMILEAIRLGYYGDRSEYYGGPNRAMDMGDENLEPVDDEMGLRFMRDIPYSIDDSSDVMDSEDLEFYPSDEMDDLERHMRRGGHRLSSHLYDDDEVGDMEMPYMGFDDPLVMEGQTNTGTSAESIKKLVEYLTQQGMKYSGIGLAVAAVEIGDQLIDKVTRGDLEGAAEMFMSRYGHM